MPRGFPSAWQAAMPTARYCRSCIRAWLRRDFSPQGYARQLLKDLEMVNAFAGGLKAPLPMTGEALSLYRMLIHLGYAELDTGAVFRLYERDAAP